MSHYTRALCDTEGCTKTRKAKGLCSTHYNQTHQPNRHAKVPMSCAYCGATVLKGKGKRYRPTCSDQCRNALQFPPKCELPDDHWALWFGTSSTWPRHALTQCNGCNELFAPTKANTTCCSDTCKRVKELLDSGSMTEAMRNTIVRECATCNEDYTSPYVGQTSCTPCRTRYNKGKWITPTRRAALYARDRHMCHLCGERTNPNAHHLDWDYPTLDHLVPRSQGGTHADYNLATSHRGCNTRRGVEELPMLQLC